MPYSNIFEIKEIHKSAWNQLYCLIELLENCEKFYINLWILELLFLVFTKLDTTILMQSEKDLGQDFREQVVRVFTLIVNCITDSKKYELDYFPYQPLSSSVYLNFQHDEE